MLVRTVGQYVILFVKVFAYSLPIFFIIFAFNFVPSLFHGMGGGELNSLLSSSFFSALKFWVYFSLVVLVVPTFMFWRGVFVSK